jgi:quercetin dioxygenase-like cupin family protein
MTADRGRIGSFRDLPLEEPYPGLHRRTFESEGATVNQYVFAPSARFPLHRHPQEQITLVEYGEVEMTIAGEVSTLSGGDWSVVAADVEHGIQAGPGGARILAIVVPRRRAADVDVLD